MTPVLILILVQAVLGATDNLVHHELEAALPSRPGARTELSLHAAREAIYAVLFAGLAWLEWRGLWAFALAALLLAEIAITLKDFLVEDATRRLPPFERALHAVLAIGYGAILALLAPTLLGWAVLPSALVSTGHGAISWILTLAALGVGAWSVRNWIAVAALANDGAPISTATAEGTVLVTGATGFIGRRLTAALLAQQRRVIVLTRDRLAARAQFGPAPLIVESLDELPDELDGGRHRQPRRRQRRRRPLDGGAAARAAVEPGRDHPAAGGLRRAAAARARRAGERLGGGLLRRRRPDAAGRARGGRRRLHGRALRGLGGRGGADDGAGRAGLRAAAGAGARLDRRHPADAGAAGAARPRRADRRRAASGRRGSTATTPCG